MKTAMKRLIAAAFALLLTQAALAGVKIEHWVSPSGASVYFVESRILPMLDVQVDFAAGSMFDPAGKSGLAALTRATLDNGAGKLDETAIAEQLADLGASLGGGADTDRASISLRTLSPRDKRDPALDILKTVVQAPLFDAAIFEREKARTIAGLKEAMTRPDSIAGKAFWAALYPDHPYGRQATPETVAALTRDDLAAFHGRYYTAANASITLVGDLSRQEAEQIADKLQDFGVLVLGKPFTAVQFRQAVQIAASNYKRLAVLRAENAKLLDKIAQLRLVDRAKCYLIEKKGMTETEAHRLIEKGAMDTRRSRGEVAQEILEDEEEE